MPKITKNYDLLAQRLGCKRAEQRKTQAEVAASAGISVSYYSEIETGKCVPPQHRMSKILDAIGFNETESYELLKLTAIGRGLSPDDIDLPEEIQELIQEIRKYANAMKPRFIKGLRNKIREAIS